MDVDEWKKNVKDIFFWDRRIQCWWMASYQSWNLLPETFLLLWPYWPGQFLRQSNIIRTNWKYELLNIKLKFWNSLVLSQKLNLGNFLCRNCRWLFLWIIENEDNTIWWYRINCLVGLNKQHELFTEKVRNEEGNRYCHKNNNRQSFSPEIWKRKWCCLPTTRRCGTLRKERRRPEIIMGLPFFLSFCNVTIKVSIKSKSKPANEFNDAHFKDASSCWFESSTVSFPYCCRLKNCGKHGPRYLFCYFEAGK